VDAAMGRVLRSANEHFGSVTEWVSLEVGVELPDDVFTWHGPFVDAPTHEEQEAEQKADMAQRRVWLDARGVADLPIPAEPELHLNDWDDASGAFFVTIRLNAHGALVRRPRSDEPWPQVDQMRHEHAYRWSDPRWDWCIAGEFEISDEQLALLKVRLATTT
jgi:hypothetical protein